MSMLPNKGECKQWSVTDAVKQDICAKIVLRDLMYAS
jgi:hypothetical protein